MMGAGLLWVGWFGFNSGSTLASDLQTARALTMTQVSAASGALTWLLIEAIMFKKATSLGFVSGILAGLVVITPAAGVVQPGGALILGACSSIACYYALIAKNKFGYDDSLDCFGIHGVGSGLGVLLLSFLYPSKLDGSGGSKYRKRYMDSNESVCGTAERDGSYYSIVCSTDTYYLCNRAKDYRV